MRLLDDLKMYGRFGFGLRKFLSEPLTLEAARARIQHNLSQREPNFLRLLDRAVFGYPKSPYSPALPPGPLRFG